MCNDYRLMVALASVIEDFEHLKIKIRYRDDRPDIEARKDVRNTDTAPVGHYRSCRNLLVSLAVQYSQRDS